MCTIKTPLNAQTYSCTVIRAALEAAPGHFYCDAYGLVSTPPPFTLHSACCPTLSINAQLTLYNLPQVNLMH